VPVLAGATAESLSGSAALARALEVAGASAIVLMPPSRMGLSARELRDFFTSVAATTDLPVIVQDAPEFLDSRLSPEIVAAAAERAPTICGAKLEHGPEELHHWRAVLPDGFAVFSGNGGLHLLDSLDVGVTGVMPAADLTDVLVEIYQAWVGERLDEAHERFARVVAMLVYEMQSMPHSNRCAKYVLRRRGVPLQTMLRAPASPSLEPAAVARLEQHLERVVRLG
jgi:dihydrodipicolinate synthase/N-acetylneuraminate lyase